MAVIRVCRPGIPDHELKREYDHSVLADLYPHAGICPNTVASFLNHLGTHVGSIRSFMKKRCEAVHLSHHVLIDGTLKPSDSKVNTFSG